VVVLQDDAAADMRRGNTTFDPLASSRRLLDGLDYDLLVATGYGRKLAAAELGARAITEIQAHALGAAHLFPRCRSVLDIGGQDTKVMALDDTGRVAKFEMNDRCAAGTGKFLEFMATSLQMPVEEFGAFALGGREGLAINSMCTVFAESEATSLMARGAPAADIALALHLSVVRRSLSMMRRVGLIPPLMFAGGVAHNPCMRELIGRRLEGELLVPEAPEAVGALGAALWGRKQEV
jgi:predicted CoA-substrate-specific enzyme activase